MRNLGGDASLSPVGTKDDLFWRFSGNRKLDRACNSVQGATATLAFTATSGLWNL
jgi:hypothetical protein